MAGKRGRKHDKSLPHRAGRIQAWILLRRGDRGETRATRERRLQVEEETTAVWKPPLLEGTISA